LQSQTVRNTHEVRKWANDCRVSVWITFMGEIS
jgi:hypothetical protein